MCRHSSRFKIQTLEEADYWNRFFKHNGINYKLLKVGQFVLLPSSTCDWDNDGESK
jgi:hypothetical protein